MPGYRRSLPCGHTLEGDAGITYYQRQTADMSALVFTIGILSKKRKLSEDSCLTVLESVCPVCISLYMQSIHNVFKSTLEQLEVVHPEIGSSLDHIVTEMVEEADAMHEAQN